MDPNKKNNQNKNNNKKNKNLRGVLTLVAWAVVLTVLVNYLSAYAGNATNKASSHEVPYSQLWQLVEQDRIDEVTFEGGVVYATPEKGFVYTDEKGKTYTHSEKEKVILCLSLTVLRKNPTRR